MKRRPVFLTDILIYLSIYPLLIFVTIFTVVAFSLASPLVDLSAAPAPTRRWQRVMLPTVPITPTPASVFSNQADELSSISQAIQQPILPVVISPTPAPTLDLISGEAGSKHGFTVLKAGLVHQSNSSVVSLTPPPASRNLARVDTVAWLPAPAAPIPVGAGINAKASVSFTPNRQQATGSQSKGLLSNWVGNLFDAFNEATSTPAPIYKRVSLPTLTPTPASTNTPTPTKTPAPTDTPLPTATPSPTQPVTPTQTNTPAPTHPPTATLMPSPTAIPSPTLTPVPDYDFMLAEFYNSPTTNQFLMVYVAIVDPNEIPIGDMKIVGTRLDNNMTYESPLSTWHYEGYNAPGEHIKSGNVKFEPPGGIESTSWVVHLVDAHGNRQSVDIPFDVDASNQQWYFIKLRRKY